MSKKIGLIGCGNLGYPLARYVGQLGFEALHVCDLEASKAAKLRGDIEQLCPALQVMDNLDTNDLDVVLLSLSGPATIDFVTDERNYDVAAHDALDRCLAERGVALLFGFGLEPGLVEILMHDVASRHAAGTVTRLRAVCGGVPQHPIPPLNYDLLFGDRLPVRNRMALMKIHGQLGHCRRFDMKETRYIDGIGILDVYHDGLSPYLLRSPHFEAIPAVKQQTARWPGFYDCVRNLSALGLLDERALPGDTASPSDLVHHMLVRNGKLARNRPDFSFVEVVAELASGEREALSILAMFDESTNLTGMAQLTSFLAVWTARRIADLPALCRSGLMLSHEFYDHDTTCELLTAYSRYARCFVRTSSAIQGEAPLPPMQKDIHV